MLDSSQEKTMRAFNRGRCSVSEKQLGAKARVVAELVLVVVFTSVAYGQESKRADVLPGTVHDLTSDEVALVKAQTKALIEKYYTIDAARYPIETHLIPHVILGRNIIVTSAEQSTERYKRRQELLMKEHPERDESIFTAVNVCVLSAGAAIVSGYFTVTAKDRSVIGVEGVAYVLSKEPQGWRIVTFASTAPDRVVRCEREPL
jgi:hypothetical protein